MGKLGGKNHAILNPPTYQQLRVIRVTLQGINISHLRKRKIIFKSAFLGGYVSSLEGITPLRRTLLWVMWFLMRFSVQTPENSEAFQPKLPLIRTITPSYPFFVKKMSPPPNSSYLSNTGIFHWTMIIGGRYPFLKTENRPSIPYKEAGSSPIPAAILLWVLARLKTFL